MGVWGICLIVFVCVVGFFGGGFVWVFYLLLLLLFCVGIFFFKESVHAWY